MKKWAQLLLCLLVSAGIWLIHNLSQTYVNIVSVSIVAESNIDGRSRRSTSDATVTAQVRASGFRQASLGRRDKRPVTVVFDAADFSHVGGDVFALKGSELYKYTTAIFGDGVSIESLISDSPKFIFHEVSHKKVPVRRVHSISFAHQYMSEEGMQLQPDSVIVYGETSRLENIGYVLTRPIELHNIRSSVHGKVRLEVPSGVRLSDEEVIYSMEVTRYVELKAEMPVGVRNLPSGVELSVLPSTATVTFRCIFPTPSDPSSETSFYIDYRDFANSITGRCVARCSGLPSSVLSYDMEPEVFDCVVRSSR